MKEAIERTRLDHFVSVETLENEEVTALIKRAGELKWGAAPQYARTKYAVNLFLKAVQEPIKVLKWQKTS